LRQAAVEEADTEVTVIAAAVDLAAAWQRDPLSPIAAAVAAAEILIRAERETKPRASLRSGRQELIVVDEVEAAQAAVVAGVAMKTATPLTLEMLASEMELLAAASWAAVVAVAAGIAAAEEGADLLTFVSDEVVGLQSAPAAAAEQELPRWNKSRIHRTDLMEGRMMP